MIRTNLLLAGDDGYNLTKSLRFRSSASAYMNRTPASATNRKTWTWSGWVKRGSLGGNQAFFNCYFGNNDTSMLYLAFASDNLNVGLYSTSILYTSQVFRDPSAWYHIVLAIDTTQATASNRAKLYVNGNQVTAFGSTSYPTQNTDLAVNSANSHTIGYINGVGYYFDGYQAETNFIDGQVLTPSSFGSTNALTGVWQPAKYTGTYGTNGFYLPFTNTTSTSTLGNDFSGNSNTWTVNNISLTAGSTYDSMNDVPTLTSATVANYCVLNPLDKDSDITTSNGNLAASTSTIAHNLIRSTIAIPSSGKFYAEMRFDQTMTGNPAAAFGLISPSASLSAHIVSAGNYSVYGSSSTTLNSGATGGATITGMTSGQIWQFAVDADNNQAWVGLNNAWYNVYTSGATTGNPSAGTNPTFTATMAGLFLGADFVNSSGSINFGQQGFAYTPPTGFVALNTFNLSTSTIVKGNTVMDATTYTGTGASLSVVNTAGFKPDLVWIKSRSAATDNKLTDSVRGTTKGLISNTTGAETTDTQGLTAFGTGGFTVGTNTDYNNLSATYVGWQWQAGQGTTSSNTSGSITSTVSVNATAGFSVVTYTGTAANATVGHGLGVAPSMIITKNRDSSTAWWVYHASLGNTKYIVLNTTAAEVTSSSAWNNTSPTSSVFSLGAANPSNANQDVAYCWSEIAGFSKFGSYTGNGSTDGTFVYLGFRPKFILFKQSSSAGNDWYIFDSVRSTYNVATNRLFPNSSAAEATNFNTLDILSNGWKFRDSNSAWNGSGSTYIYMAFAENPFKNALAR
jgi:hypothetical protein